MNKLCGALFLSGLMLLTYGCKSDDHSIDTPPETGETTGSISSWLTTDTEAFLLAEQKPIDFSNLVGDFSIQLDTTVTYQTMDGFGAALTGSSAYLINKLSAENRAKLLTDLFDPVKGIGINYLRITIGSSDFSIGTYSYCDSGNINDFDIPYQDRKDLLPVLKEILQINPTIKILASPWSAPAWMKQNNNMFGGSLKKEADIYNDFAEYFVKYVQAFEKEGIHIDALTIQNEPMNENNTYPTMKMEWDEQNMIIRDYLGPKFTVNGIKTKIVIWDHNFDMESYPANILSDPLTRQYIAGTGWHGYGGDPSAIDVLQQAHPGTDTYFTEISGGGWNTGTRMSTMFYYMENFLMATVNRGSKNFLMWNLALNTNNGPVTTTTGGCQDCRGVVTVRDDGTYYRELEYYVIGHFSKAVRLGAQRIKYTANKMPGSMLVSSFVNTDGSKVVVVTNRTGSKQNYNIRCGTRRFIYEQPSGSVVTFKFN
ncbi:MAG: glucan endo-1,6-beta-glucosidase [Candidatus Azobacteroides sp.]|nr:glucan endo-1,6-beta-glucosidase [Candidatus Azobacteroides sp.]